jgi:predicted permease
MQSFIQAARSLARRPAFALIATVTLGAGAGLSAAVFSVVHAVVWRPLPFPDPGELVAVYEAGPGARQRIGLVAPARLVDWQRLTTVFEGISGSYAESITETSGAEPERLAGQRVAPGFFDVWRRAPLAGRTFSADEERFGGPAVAVISEALWERRFRRAAAAIGGRLLARGVAYTIVGVMPREVAGSTDVWLPAQFAPGMLEAREARFLIGIGRLRPGVTIDEGRADLARVQSRLAAQFPASDEGWSVELRELKDAQVGEYRRPLVLLLAAVGLLFAIAAANVAALVLVQLRRRAAEFALRAALGASRGRIAAAVLRETLLIALAASVCAAAVMWTLSDVLGAAMATVPRAADARAGVASLLFTLAVMAVAMIVVGALPAAVAARRDAAPALGQAGRGVAGGRHRAQHALVAAQLALSVLLTACAALLVRSYAALAAVDTGVDARGVITFHMGAAWDEDRARIGLLQLHLLDELRRVPGVRAAGFTSFLPATGATLRYQVHVDGLAGTDPGGGLSVGQRTITPGYLRALQVPLVAGRTCEDTRADVSITREREAVVNRAFVGRFAGERGVIARGFSFEQQGGARFRIVGVIGDVREDGPATPPSPYVYVCQAAGAWPDPEYVVRTDADPRALPAGIRQIVREVDASRPVFAMQPLQAVLDAALEQPRMDAAAVTLFASAAMALAALGVSGVLLLMVGERRREIGVRLALGATGGDIVQLVFGSAARLVAVGLGTGVALTCAAAPLLRSFLFGVGPLDAVTLLLAAGTLLLASLGATALPIRQALSVSPIDAMRQT